MYRTQLTQKASEKVGFKILIKTLHEFLDYLFLISIVIYNCNLP
jgi:hypothetical protein